MVLRQLKTTSPVSLLIYILFAVLFLLFPVFQHPIAEIYNHPILSAIAIMFLSLILPLLQSLGLNNLIYEKDVIKKNSLVVAPVFLLLCTPFISETDAWIVSLLLLFYINTILSCFQKEKPFALAFNANFLLGSISLFYTDILLLFPLTIVAFLTFRNLTWRSLMIALIGLTLPILLYWIYTFLFGVPFVYSTPTYQLPALNLPQVNHLAYAELPWYIIVGIITALSLLEMFFWMYKKSIRSRKSFFIILAYLLFVIFIDFENSCFLTLTPTAVIIANFLVYSKQTRLTEILFFVFLMTSIYYRFSI